MKTIGFTFSNGYFDLPDEDSFFYVVENGNICGIVADGITRDPLNIKILPAHNTHAFSEFVKKYPRPSPAKIVSDILCKNFVSEIINAKKKSSSAIIQSLKKANNEVFLWNKKNIGKPNYLDKDIGGTVAAAFSCENKILTYSYNSDCGVAVFDKNGENKFISKDLMVMCEDVRRRMGVEMGNWNEPDARKEIRSLYRNTLKKSKSGECAAHGAFTGEKIAFSPELLSSGKISVSSGDCVIVFSDGARDYVENKKKCGQMIKKGLSYLKKYLQSGRYTKKERTIVAFFIE
jgi:serine/threonine protein phosphatase PrpC